MSKLILKPAVACALFLFLLFQPTKAVSEPFAFSFVGVAGADLAMASNDTTASSYLDSPAAHSYSEPSMLIDYTWVFSEELAADAVDIPRVDMRASTD